MSYVNCNLRSWPTYQSIINYFPNIVSLQFKQCNLDFVTKEHIRDYITIRELFLNENKIKSLPGDLFHYSPQLEVISFKNNRIKFIDSDIFAPLRRLRYFDLSGNERIDVVYDASKSSISLLDVQMKIENNCKLRVEDVQHLLLESQPNPQSYVVPDLIKKNEKLLKQNEEKQKLIVELKGSLRYWMSLNKDFTITVDEQDFKVHKSVIAEASPLIGAMINENSEAETLELKDISVKIFKEIMEFMYDKKFPHQSANIVELYSVSSRLEMKQLAEFASRKLVKAIDKSNAYDILNLSNKYDDEHLRAAAFNEFKKIFPDRKFSDDVAKQPEALAKIMAMKDAMDKAFASLQL
jgi:hypothetical protein